MKKINLQILLIIVVFTIAAPIRAMSRALLLPRAGGTRVVSPSWSRRFLTWVSGAHKRVPVHMPKLTIPSLFAWGGQARTYSATPVQQASFWDKSTALFKAKPLTPQEIDMLLYGSIINNWKRYNGTIKDRWMFFGDKELQNAKEKLGAMLDNDPALKNRPIDTWRRNYIDFAVGSYGDVSQTILDKVLFCLLTGDLDYTRVELEPREDSLNYIELIKYLMSKGATIDAANYELYKDAYRQCLMGKYKELFAENYFDPIYFSYASQKLKEIFDGVDPIFEQLIPGFKDQIIQAQKERADIEANPRKYKEIREDEHNRYEYKCAKARQLCWQSGDFDAYYTEFLDKVRFDEAEYQAWLKAGKDKNYFINQDAGRSDRARFEYPPGFNLDDISDDAAKNLTTYLGIPLTASEKEIKDAVASYRKLHHPDLTPQGLSPEKKEAERQHRTKATANINVLFGKYNDERKQQLVTK